MLTDNQPIRYSNKTEDAIDHHIDVVIERKKECFINQKNPIQLTSHPHVCAEFNKSVAFNTPHEYRV